VAAMKKIRLAHPLDAEQAARLRAAEIKDYQAGEEIEVPEVDAIAIINAGYAAGVNPRNPEAVRAALAGRPRAAGKATSAA